MTTTDIIKFSFARTENDTHAHTHARSHHLTLKGVQTVCTLPDIVHQNQKGVQTKPMVRLPVTFQEVRALETRDLYFLCSATLKTQDFEGGCGAAMILLAYRMRLLKRGYCSDTTSLLCVWLFLAEQILAWVGWGVYYYYYYYVHAAHKQLH